MIVYVKYSSVDVSASVNVLMNIIKDTAGEKEQILTDLMIRAE